MRASVDGVEPSRDKRWSIILAGWRRRHPPPEGTFALGAPRELSNSTCSDAPARPRFRRLDSGRAGDPGRPAFVHDRVWLSPTVVKHHSGCPKNGSELRNEEGSCGLSSCGGGAGRCLRELRAEGGAAGGQRLRPPEGNAERGKQAFLDLKCHACHEVEGIEAPRQWRSHKLT